MAPEALFGIALAAAVVVGVVAKLIPRRQPTAKVFKCSRCGASATHNDRTIEAWRSGKTRFFCQACHAKWLQSRPPQERGSFRPGSASSSGCLGVVAWFAVLPLGCLLAWAYI
ncbi:hypothetical protein [Lysobacter terrae]